MIYLRKLRQEKGLTIRSLSKETGISEPTIRNIEVKNYKTSKSNLKKLADFFEIDNAQNLMRNVTKTSRKKKCLNQRCPLNKQKYCQSDQVCEGYFCESQNEVSDPVKEVKLNGTQALFVE